MGVVRLADVDQGQHHEDEGLQRDDQDVEYRPADPEHRAEDGSRKAGRSPQPEEQEDDLARVHVPEQPQGMRQRL